MLGTILSFLIALALWVFPTVFQLDFTILKGVALGGALLLIFLFAIASFSIFSSLQRVEQNLTPRLIDLYKKDTLLTFSFLWVIAFALASLLLSLTGFSIGNVNPTIFAMFWILGFGASLDLFAHFYQRQLSYLNPFEIVELFTKSAKSAVQNEREADLCNTIDALAEVGMKSLHKSSTSLCTNALDELQKIVKIYLQSEKSISHKESNQVSFTLFYLFQRLEMISLRAVQMQLEPVESALIVMMGKITVYAAQFDLTLVSFPLHYLGKFARDAQKKGLPEVAVRAQLTLVEVAKEIIEKVDLSYAMLQEPFFTLIGEIEELSKEAFRQNKNLSFKILNQPFLSLKELFESEKLASHQDTPLIRRDIERVLDEFANLEVVMKTIPPKP